MAGWGAGEQGLASAAGRPMRVGGELGHAYGIRLLRRTGWSVRHAAARCGIGGTVAGIIGIIGIAVPAIAYAASAGWRAAGGLGMAFQHYRMRGRGDGMRVFRVDLRRIAMEGCASYAARNGESDVVTLVRTTSPAVNSNRRANDCQIDATISTITASQVTQPSMMRVRVYADRPDCGTLKQGGEYRMRGTLAISQYGAMPLWLTDIAPWNAYGDRTSHCARSA